MPSLSRFSYLLLLPSNVPEKQSSLDPFLREAIIREMANVHSASVEGIDKYKHRSFRTGEFNRNTFHVQRHIGKLDF